MVKDPSDSVNIFFVNPVDIISVVISTITKIQYEAYTISENDRNNILTILPENVRNVVFFCITNKASIDSWFEYVQRLQSVQGTQVLVGAFVYRDMPIDEKEKFLFESVAVIALDSLKENTAGTIKKILTFFEAKSKKPYIIAKTYGQSEALFYIQNMKNPITAKINQISAYGFSCEIDPVYKPYFRVNTFFNDSLLVLKGARLRTSLKVIGFHEKQSNLYMMKFCSSKIEDGKYMYIESISSKISDKIHDYIRACLNERMTERLGEARGERKSLDSEDTLNKV